MVLAFKGRKSSSSSKKATRHDDTLFGTDTVEALLAVSEGPVKGWPKGASSFFVGDVPLLDEASSTPNISNFELRLLKGTDPADSIKLNLGGTAATRNIGLELRTPGQQIVAQGTKTQIDFIDFRFVVQRLVGTNKDGGEFATNLSFKIEVKPRSSAVWQIPFSNEIPPDEDLSGASSYRPGVTTPGSVVNGAYRETYVEASAPTAADAVGAMWFQTGKANWEPAIWNGTGWVRPTNLSASNRSGYPIWTWVDFDGAIRTAWYSGQGLVPPPGTLAAGDFLITPQSGEQIYSYNDTAWVGFQSWGAPNVVAPGTININGLTRSSYPKEYRVPVARINEPYDIRVTRITAATTKETFADITFESIQEVNQDVRAYPNLAIAWLTIKATDTFTSIPEFTSVMQGLVIPVPSNCIFNETTKLDEYTGIWDGSFKMAYTNSPAWHAYNFIMNARYGKNSYYPEVADKWDFYAFARHCVLHKMRFNEYITEARPLNELINYIVGIAGGRYIDRGDGYSSVLWDADDQPAVAIFAPENTVEGAFNYSFTDVTERKNDFKVSFKNPELNYREDRLRVYDQNSIDIYGRNAEEFVAVGCRDPEEAVRRGRLRLATALTECIIVNFKTNRLGRYLTPFQVILIADDQSTNVLSGRVLNHETLPAGTSVLPLRDQIYLEAGIAYSVSFTLSDGNGGLKVVSYPLTVTTPGQQSVLRLSSALAEPLPEYAVFSIGTPKAFRVTSIVEADDDKDSLDITAIEVNRQKWAFVDGLVELRDILAVQTGPLSKYVYPVSGASIIPEITLDGHYNLVVKWNPSETKLIRGYRLYQSLNQGPMNLLAEPSDTQYTIADVTSGTYVVSIVAVGLDGTTESPPVTVQYIVSNATSLRSVAQPTNLRLVDEPEAPIFRAVDPRFTWDAAADPLVTRYLVEVLGPSNNVIHTERVEGQLTFQYTLAANKADNGGTPIRQFTVRLSSIDSTGNLSTPISLVVSHPPPAVLSFDLSAVSESVFVSYTAPTTGWAGALIWMETVDGFNPLTTTPRYDGMSTFVSLPATRDTNYYVRVAAYDSYGKTGLNISAQKRIFTSIKLFDPNGPAQPTGLALSTAPVILADGTVMASITATWDAPLATDTAYGQPEIEFGEGTGPGVSFIADRVPADQRTWTRGGFRPGITYSVRLRFRPNATALGLGPYTVIQTIVAALNLTPPGNPSNVVVTTGFGFNAITLSLPANKDLKHIEVWAVVGNNASATPAGGATLIGRIADTSTQFFDYAVTGQQKTYWLRAVNTSDVVATSYVRVLSSVSPQIQAAQLAAQIVDDTKVATALLTNVPKPLASVPTTKDREIILVSGKLYRWDATANAYTAAVQAVDVGYGLTSEQLVSVQAAKVAGTLSDAQLAGIAAAKLIGSVVDTQIAGLSASKLAGQVTSDQIAALQATKVAGTLSDAQLAGISSNKLIGSVVDTQIASIAAAKVAGQLTNEQIATLAATKISGTLSDAQVAGISAGKLIGSIVDSQLVGITAGKVTGQLTDTQLAGLSAAKVSGQLTSAQIASLDAVKLSGQIVSAQLADAAVTLAKFGTGTQPIATVAGLPSPTNYAGALTLLNTNDGKIYRYISGAWQSWTAAGDIAGSIVDSQLAGISAAKIAGQLSDAQVAALSATKVSGQLSNAQLAGIDAAKLIGSVVSSQISSLDAAKIANQLTSAQIASLDAAKVAGQLSNAQLAGIDANKLIGQVVAAQVASVNAAAVGAGLTSAQISSVNATAVSGQLSNAQLASLDVAKLSGQIVAGQIASVNATAISGQLSDGQLASLSATKLAGQITGTQITDSAVSTAKLAAGAVIADKIAAGSIVTSKLLIASTNLMLNSNGALMSRATSNPLGMSSEANNTGIAPVLYRDARYAGPGTYSFLMRMASTPAAGTVTDMGFGNVSAAGAPTNRNPVTGGQRYEASVYVTTFNCAATLYIDSVDSTGAAIRREYTSAAFGPLGVPTRLGGFFTVASNATAIAIRVRANWDGGTNYHLFVAAPMLATVVTSQTELSPYVDSGVTVMDGSSITTGSINADRIVANSLTAGQIASRTIVASNIATGTLTANELGANSVTAGKIDAGAVSAREIVAGSITGDRITGNTISGTQLIANTIGTREIIANVITTNQIAAGGVNADRLVANSITAGQIGANAVTAGKIDAGAISAREIVAGSILASKLAIASTNLLPNGGLEQGGLGWTGGGGSSGQAIADVQISSDWSRAGTRSYGIGFTGNPTGYMEIMYLDQDVNGAGVYTRVSPNAWYEASAYLSTHRSRGVITVVFRQADGTYITESTGTSIIEKQYGDGQSQGTWDADARSWLVFLTPANCTRVDIRFRFYNVSGNPYLFVNSAMLAPCRAGQTEPSPYVAPGTTTINGGQLLTDSIGARQIIAGSVTATEIAGRTITAGNIATGTLTANELGANSVTAGKVDASAITAREIAAGSIVASKIQIASQNRMFNGDLSQGLLGISASNPSIRTDFAPAGFRCLQSYVGGTPAAGSVSDVNFQRVDANGVVSDYPITAGSYYEFSAYVSPHRCTAQVYIAWLNASGTTIGYAGAGGNVTSQGVSGGPLKNFPRCVIFGQAPAGAVTARPVGRMLFTGDTECYVFWSALQFTDAVAGQTEASPWSRPGVTTLDGANILTDSIGARQIIANSITASEILAGSITATEIAGNTIRGTNLLAETIGSREIITRVITADKIAGGAISAYEIASRTIVAGNLVSGTITAGEIAARTITATNLVAGTITANEIASRTITAGLISAGTLTATEIAAGAITASKLTIGSGNFCINSNGFQVNAQTGLQLGAAVSNAALQGLRLDNAFAGTYPFCIRPIGTPAAGSFSFVEFNMLDAAGNATKRHPVQAGMRYEFSAYVSGYDAQQTVLFVDWILTNGTDTARGYTEQRAATAAVTRYGGFATAPSNAIAVVLRVGAYWNGGTNGHLFVSAPLMAGAPAGINELSPWTNSGVTQIDGSTIRTGSIEAVQIRAGSITAGLLAARTITSAQIAAGTISTTEIGAGQITGEKISAGTLTAREIAGGAITAGKLTIANRNLQITGLNIRYVVATRRIEWDGANIYYIDDNGTASGATVTPGGFTVNGNSWYSILWYQGRTYLDYQADINYGMNNSGFVTIATYDNGNGLDVKYGSTIIDGARIVTNSILADKIVAGAITAREIAVRTIDATKIVGGTIGAYEIGAAVITGEKISAGAISAREIAAGSILASKIAVASNNILPNGGLLLGSAGWSASGGTTFTGIDTFWGRSGNPAYRAVWNQWTDGHANEVYAFAPDVNGTGQRTRVSPNTWYEASAYISSHRSATNLAVIFWREDGSYITEVAGNLIDQQAPSSGNTQDFWDSAARSWKVFQTPSDCRFVDVRFRVVCRAADPNVFINSAMLATCKPNQAEPSPYVSPGATVIDGNAVLTDSIGARQIVANSITATEIAGRTITADKIGVGAISADELGVNSVTAVKIGVRQIDATKLVGYTITAYEISSQAIEGRTIKADAIEGYHIKADTIGSREIIANSITAGEIQAGAIGVDQLAAGAITADKIGVGLNSGNLIFNSDLMAGNVGLAYGFTSQPNMFIGVAGIGEPNTPWGMASAYINHSGSPNGTYGDISFRSYRADGFIRERTPVQAGKRYEISCYVSCFRHAGADIGVACYDGNGNLVADFHSGRVNGTSGGQLNYWVRATMMFDMPGTVTDVIPYIRSYYNGQASPHTFVSGFFFAAASPKQTQFSDWSPAAYTVISGGQIATNTLSADKIIAGTITTDKLLAGSINADRMEITSLKARVLAAGAVTADTITVGNGNLSSLISGSNSTKINGASISTNSIRASQVQIGMRGLNVIGVNMRYVVATRRVEWDSGAIFWINNDGNLQSVSTTGGSFQPSGNDWYSILWYQGRTYFDYNSDVNFAINTGDPNWVTLATYDNGTGLSVNFGSTIIDGDRIVTGSIKADRIGANQIQASHISAGAITADKIGAGAVSADKISAGNITAETILIGGNCMRLWTDSNGGRIAMLNNESNQWRAVFGNLGPWGYGATDYGLVCWNGSGSEVLRVSSNGTRINGAIIDAASIGSAQIGALTVKSAHIENLTIGNGKVASGGITTVVSANSGSGNTNSAGVNIYKRDGKFQIYCFMRGNGVTTTLLQAGTQTGTLSVYAQGDNFGRTLIEAINMPIATIWRAQDGGNHVYTSPFGYSFTWAGNGSQNYYFTVEYNGSLANTGVAIHVSEISK